VAFAAILAVRLVSLIFFLKKKLTTFLVIALCKVMTFLAVVSSP